MITFAPHFEKMQQVVFKDLGFINYQEAWDTQGLLLKEVVDRKLVERKELEAQGKPFLQKHYLLFCEHPPVYTLGRSGAEKHLLLSEEELKDQGFQFYKINRGGDITYHGPGQVVAYPIFDLDYFFTDVHKYVRYLEEVVIRCLAEYGVTGTRIDGYSGVWLEATSALPKRKICAIGVHLSRWVTMHGFAFNVNTDLGHFNNIIPCGIQEQDRDVTSLSQELNQAVSLKEVQPIVEGHFRKVFGF